MSMDMTRTNVAGTAAGRVYIPPGPADPEDISARSLLRRLLEAQERQIKAQRAALDAYAREVGQLLAVLRQE